MSDRTCVAVGCVETLAGRATKFCSTRCHKRESQRRRTGFYERASTATCRDCGTDLAAPVLGTEFFRAPVRCKPCASARHAALHAEAYSASHDRTPIEFRRCLECDCVFVYPGRDKFCSERCRRTNKGRNARARRRVRQSGLPSEPISLFILGCRDGWTCHIRRGRVRRRRGNDSRAPSIDHLIPVSDGGPNVWSNVALAHKGCNSRRRTGGTAQLRLI
jgi:hypothetical protein